MIRTGCTAESNCLRTDAQREALAEVDPRRRAPEDGEGENVEDGERDEGVPALLIALCQELGGRAIRRQRGVPNEARDDRARCFECSAGKERLGKK